MLYYKYTIIFACSLSFIFFFLSLSHSFFFPRLPLSSHAFCTHTLVTTKYDSFSLYLQRYFRCIFKSIIELIWFAIFNTNSVFIQYHSKNRPKYWLIFFDTLSLLLCMMRYTDYYQGLQMLQMFTMNCEKGNHSVITRMICVRIYIGRVINYFLLKLTEMWEDGFL